ncbi:hypothetical protein [Paenibacillus sp. L3-i20]|uniref:hypothetical protein n=1 Tax=Paenibacillus sp. L3-i20 TaxID=2905833 RepID=UPI0020C072CA|nr:hypothetical protein [Paenibacillus sp. L3-i20]
MNGSHRFKPNFCQGRTVGFDGLSSVIHGRHDRKYASSSAVLLRSWQRAAYRPNSGGIAELTLRPLQGDVAFFLLPESNVRSYLVQYN